MIKPKAKQNLKQRSTWIAAMVACFAFLLMAVKVYKLSISSLLFNLLIMLVGLLVIIALAAILGWLISMRQNRKKVEIENRNKKAK